VHDLTICNGTPSTCASLYPSGSGVCNAQTGCSYNANSCPSQPDQGSCEGVSCTWVPGYCGGDNAMPNSCGGQANSTDCSNAGCGPDMSGDCTSASSTDEATCLALNANGGDCAWSDPDCTGTGYYVGCSGDNSTSNTCPGIGDQSSCDAASPCAWVYDACSGDNGTCSGSAAACNTFGTSGTCAAQAGCSFSTTPACNFGGDTIITADGYLQFKKTSAGAPTAGDCNASGELGRMVIDTSNNRLYICNGATRQWDYIALTD